MVPVFTSLPASTRLLRSLFVLLLALTSLVAAGKPKKPARKTTRGRVAAVAPAPPKPFLTPLAGMQDPRNYDPREWPRFRSATSPGQAYLPQRLAPADTIRYALKSGAVVLGWHPYWLNNAYVNYNFSLLSHVAYFGYQIDSQGGVRLPAHQSPAGLLEAARARNGNCKVLLTMSYREPAGTGSVFRAQAADIQRNLIKNIVREVENTEADGVNLDIDLWQPDAEAVALAQVQRQLIRRQAELKARQDQLQEYEETQRQQWQADVRKNAEASVAAANDEVLQLYERMLSTTKAALNRQSAALKQEQQALDQARKELAARRAALGYRGQFWGFVKRWIYLRRDTAAYRVDSVALSRQLLAHDGRRQVFEKRQTVYRTDSLSFATRKATRQQLALTDPVTIKTYPVQKRKLQQELREFEQARALLTNTPVRPGNTPRPGLSPGAILLRDFIGQLAIQLRAANPGFVLAVSVPAVDVTGAYSGLQAVDPQVAFFVIKAFDYTAHNPEKPGPLAPLHPSEDWGEHSISTSVAYYLGQGLQRRQLVVGLPHLAQVWELDSLDGEEITRPRGYLTNYQMRQVLPQGGGAPNKASLSMYYSFPMPKQLPWQAWGEDSTSLAPKYAWIAKQHLGGVGVWALGYEEGSASEWNLLRASFAGPAEVPATTAPGPLAMLLGVQHVLLLALVVLAAFLLFGLLLALVLRASIIVPNPALLSTVGGLIALCTLCVFLYVVYVGQLELDAGTLLALLGAAGVLLMGLVYRRFWQSQPLP
ncbi:hypothetical protein LJY25_02710 [Hymenobacter sp. BT175]|uniref:glycosyl hydrolase family 18 protein n=1 Tax=Hymenobacter translucens TaxID=2886507 RepID=UPI001D0F41BF|nr:glycosyl hydrolase family 18 protein [Hymenobacter translucens]MCC2545342.1 hypothetical protein [Hymenobacter translucens]